MPAGVSEGVPPPSQPAASRPLPPSLPVDALLHIFVLLGPDRLHAASGVCTSWRAVSEIDAGELWKRLGAARFGDRLAAPDVGTTPPRRVAAPSGLILLAQPELLHVRSQFEQSFAPTELAAARGEFIGGAAPPDAHNEISLGGWWKRRYFSFGVALRHDPWAGAPVHDAGLKCSAAEASSVAHGREHVCSSPLQQLRDHARHAIPHIHWAACTQCARVVCDDCVNSVIARAGSSMSRCDLCLRLYCAACDYKGALRFCDTCEHSFCRSCVSVRQCDACSSSACSRCPTDPCCAYCPELPRLLPPAHFYLVTENLRQRPEASGSSSGRLVGGCGGYAGASTRASERIATAVAAAAAEHGRALGEHLTTGGGSGVPVDVLAGGGTETATVLLLEEEAWWRDSSDDDSDDDARSSGSDGSGSRGVWFGDVPAGGEDGMAASTDSEQSGAIVEQTFAATAVMETFEMPDLYDDLSSEDDETVEAQRIAELEALVSSLTTPPEHFSAKIANEFDALFEGIVGTANKSREFEEGTANCNLNPSFFWILPLKMQR